MKRRGVVSCRGEPEAWMVLEKLSSDGVLGVGDLRHDVQKWELWIAGACVRLRLCDLRALGFGILTILGWQCV